MKIVRYLFAAVALCGLAHVAPRAAAKPTSSGALARKSLFYLYDDLGKGDKNVRLDKKRGSKASKMSRIDDAERPRPALDL